MHAHIASFQDSNCGDDESRCPSGIPAAPPRVIESLRTFEGSTICQQGDLKLSPSELGHASPVVAGTTVFDRANNDWSVDMDMLTEPRTDSCLGLVPAWSF